MIKWRQETVDWATLPLTNDVTVFDKKNDVYLTVTESTSRTDTELYNVCSLDFRVTRSFAKDEPIIYLTNWHKYLKIYTCDEGDYVMVRGRRIWIDSLKIRWRI